jgi:hypothetical protein
MNEGHPTPNLFSFNSTGITGLLEKMCVVMSEKKIANKAVAFHMADEK